MNRAHLQLADGRRLAWRSYGAETGRPILYCHGYPASAAEAAFTDDAARATGARIIAPDRPGFGDSDPAPDRNITDWVSDATALLDALGQPRAPVIGVSGGGPYALACAARAPERFPRVVTFGALRSLQTPGDAAGMAPISRLSIHLARRSPRLQAALFRPLALLIRLTPATLFRLLSADHCPADRALFRDPALRGRWIEALRQSVVQGADGAIQELRRYIRDPGFCPADIAVPVDLWHGLADTVVPPRHGEQLAAELPGCTTHFLAGEGHFSAPVHYIGNALEALSGNEGTD